MPITGAEADRLRQNYQQGATRSWLAWGPYLSERQWGTVREDYSPGGNAWEYFPHDQARSRAYRWGEDGLAGICDRAQRLCFALALWNGRDPIVKERLFGLTNDEGNHGEDVKEYYFYLDNTPTHSYMKWLYKYPQAPYPYADLVEENARRKRTDGHASEYELMDTGVFADNRYFDVQVEYAKAAAEDILCRITVTNRGPDAAELHVLPTLWFRNTWSWFTDAHKPVIQGKLTESQNGQGQIGAMQATGPEGDAAVMPMTLYCQAPDELLFVENDSNARRLWESPDSPPYPKDGINDHVVSGAATVNPELSGTKAAAHYRLHVAGGASAVIRLRLSADAAKAAPFGADFDATFATRLAEADEFYTAVGPAGLSDDRRLIQRQAYAGMLWGKQTYCYVVRDWLTGDPAGPPPPPQRDRNKSWMHFYAEDVISMPDKWEYPWFASWDLCFQSVVLARLDPQFAKEQLLNLLHEFYMSPDGAVPAYEWAFSDVNPPLHAWAALRVFDIDKQVNGGDGDAAFLAEILRYSLMYFTWWTNRKDPSEKDLFEGGFLGLDKHRGHRPQPPRGTRGAARHQGRHLSVRRHQLDGPVQPAPHGDLAPARRQRAPRVRAAGGQVPAALRVHRRRAQQRHRAPLGRPGLGVGRRRRLLLRRPARRRPVGRLHRAAAALARRHHRAVPGDLAGPGRHREVHLRRDRRAPGVVPPPARGPAQDRADRVDDGRRQPHAVLRHPGPAAPHALPRARRVRVPRLARGPWHLAGVRGEPVPRRRPRRGALGAVRAGRVVARHVRRQLRVAADRGQAAVAECFGGEPGVAHRLLEQCPEGVPELVGVKRGNAESLGELTADVLGAGDGEAVGAGGFTGRLEADEQRGGVVHPGGEVLLNRGSRFVGHLHDAFAVTFADDPQAVGFPVAAVEPEDLRDPGAGGEQQQDQRSIPLFGQCVVGQRREQLIPITSFQRLGQAFGQLGYVDGGPEVAG